jgi:molybdopterin-guanine dinucleotide biosynthesis protein A
MLGIVLCGGRSLRMGADKGLLSYQGKHWARLASDKFESVKLTVKFSINLGQKKKYDDFFEPSQLIIDHPFPNLKGPVLGLLSAHLANPTEDLFVLACDMLLMESQVLDRLKEARASNRSFEAYIFKNDGQQEPLCGIYTVSGLKKISKMLQQGRLTKFSMKFILSNLNVCETNVEDIDSRSFENFNSQKEINGL